MKILELAPYIYVEGHPYGSKNKSGLAYMVRSICDMLAMQNDVHILTQSIITEQQEINGWRLVKRNKLTIIHHFKWRYLMMAIKMHEKDKTVSLLRHILYCISAGQAEDYIKTWSPDVVHIHGIGAYTLPYYYAASYMSVPIVATLHGLVSFNNLVPASETAKEMERRFLDMCIRNHYSMTFISSGMKQRVEDYYQCQCPSITVIPNCFRDVIIDSKNTKNNEVFSLICVGSVYPLKNQIQAIRILPEIQKRVGGNKSVTLDIYGDGISLEEWKQFVINNNINGITFHGRKSQAEVFSAMTQANLLVFPSIEEGFGIPIVEAYSCGTPVVTYPDLDASPDIANEDCCIFAENRTDDSLIEAVVQGLMKEWDRSKIISFSKQFSLVATSSKYCDELSREHAVWDKQYINRILNS